MSSSTIRDILLAASKGSTVHVVESSWPTLKQQSMIDLFGDFIPRPGLAGVANCAIRGKKLALCLTDEDWSSSSAATSQTRAATMNPWTHLLSLSEFSERLSAHIVAAASPSR